MESEEGKRLKELFEQNTNVYVVQHSVSKSGLLRRVSAYFINNKEHFYLNGLIAKLTTFKQDKDGYLVLNGAGMDMHFHLVYALSCSLYGFSNDSGKGGYKLNKISL